MVLGLKNIFLLSWDQLWWWWFNGQFHCDSFL